MLSFTEATDRLVKVEWRNISAPFPPVRVHPSLQLSDPDNASPCLVQLPKAVRHSSAPAFTHGPTQSPEKVRDGHDTVCPLPTKLDHLCAFFSAIAVVPVVVFL